MGWRRVQSLRRLLASLEAAVYCGHAIELRVLLDGGAAPTVRALADGAVARWAARGGGGAAAVVDLGPASLGTRGRVDQRDGNDRDAHRAVGGRRRALAAVVLVAPPRRRRLRPAARAARSRHAPLALSLYRHASTEIAYRRRAGARRLRRESGHRARRAEDFDRRARHAGVARLSRLLRDASARAAVRLGRRAETAAAALTSAARERAATANAAASRHALPPPARGRGGWFSDFMYGRKRSVMLYPTCRARPPSPTAYMERGEPLRPRWYASTRP